MAFHLSFSLILLALTSLQPSKAASLEIKSAHHLDLIIRDYTFRSYNSSSNNNNFRTGELHKIDLPPNLSGVSANMIRFRCGSLQRYGTKLDEFSIASGVNIHPCFTRVLLVTLTLGSNWSSLYYNTYELPGYQLVSPVLALLAYTIKGTNFTTAETSNKAITIDFSRIYPVNTSSSVSPLCAAFDGDGKVALWDPKRPNVCMAKRNGYFGLVVEESPLMGLKGKVSKGKIVVVSAIGAALGAFLLSLLMIAMLANAKKKARMDELERRAYEEEALQVSMVGHVRAVVASATRTAPVIEHHEYRIPYS